MRQRFVSLLLILCLLALPAGCKARAAQEPQTDAPVKCTENYCMTDRGLFVLGFKTPGIYYVDYETHRAAMIPGTGADGLNMGLMSTPGLGVYRDRMYFEADPFGQSRFVSADLRAQDRHVLASFDTVTGEALTIGGETWYAHGCCYAVLYRHRLQPDPADNTRRTEFVRIDLTSGKTDTLLDTGYQPGMSGYLTTVDETSVYFVVLPMEIDPTSQKHEPELVAKLKASRRRTLQLYRCRFDRTEPELIDEQDAWLCWYQLFEATSNGILYCSQHGNIYSFDVNTKTKTHLATIDDLRGFYTKIDDHLYCLYGEDSTDLDWVDINLRTGEETHHTGADPVPRSRRAGQIVAFTNSGVVLISEAAHARGAWDQALKLDKLDEAGYTGDGAAP